MNWTDAIERNREALGRVLAALVAMAALPCVSVLGGRPTLPRHLHRAVLRLLRPAESAARRLVIAAARGLVVPPPRFRPRKPEQNDFVPRPGAGTGIWLPPHLRPQAVRPPRARKYALPLVDSLPRWRDRARKPASGVPRLCIPGWSERFPVAPKVRDRLPLGPDDPIDAARLGLRLGALAAALDDLPRQAHRFARWRMRQADDAGTPASVGQAARSRRPRRFCRLTPLRPGRPPGIGRRAGGGVHEILRDAHSLACQVLDGPDTS